MRKIVFAAAVLGSAFQVSGMNNENVRNEWNPAAAAAHGILKGGSTFHENANQDSPKEVRFAKNELSGQDRQLIEQGIDPSSETAKELVFRISEEHVPFFMAHLTDTSLSAAKGLIDAFILRTKQERITYQQSNIFKKMDKKRKVMVKKSFQKKINKRKEQISNWWLDQQDQLDLNVAWDIFSFISMSNIPQLMDKLQSTSGAIKYFLGVIDKSSCEKKSDRLKLISMEKWCLDQLPAGMNMYGIAGIINVVSTQNVFALLDKISDPSDENINSLALCSRRHKTDIDAWKLNRSIKNIEKFDGDIAAELIYKIPLNMANTHVSVMINNILDRLSEKSLRTVLGIFSRHKYDEFKVKIIKKWLGANYPQQINADEILPFAGVLPAIILRGSFRKLQNMSMPVAEAMLSQASSPAVRKTIMSWINKYGTEE